MSQIKNKINELIKFIKEEIFQSQEIKTQELIINDQLKIFGFADFSNEAACLEMKFSDRMIDDKKIANKYKYQLYVLSNRRPTYLLIGGYTKFIVLKVKFHVMEEYH